MDPRDLRGRRTRRPDTRPVTRKGCNRTILRRGPLSFKLVRSAKKAAVAVALNLSARSVRSCTHSGSKPNAWAGTPSFRPSSIAPKDHPNTRYRTSTVGMGMPKGLINVAEALRRVCLEYVLPESRPTYVRGSDFISEHSGCHRSACWHVADESQSRIPRPGLSPDRLRTAVRTAGRSACGR